MKNAICIWGQEVEDMDVLITLNNDLFILGEELTAHGKHGLAKKGTMYLTKEEAEALGMELIQAAGKARDYQKLAIEMNI
jgi:hypothetical protein